MKKCICISLKYDAKSTLAFFSHFEVDLVITQSAVPLAADSASVPVRCEKVWRTAAV